jgi:hypothetical protein
MSEAKRPKEHLAEKAGYYDAELVAMLEESFATMAEGMTPPRAREMEGGARAWQEITIDGMRMGAATILGWSAQADDMRPVRSLPRRRRRR